MSSNSSSTKSGGLSFLSILCLIFITLKLTGYITWSWFWVLSPVTFPIIIALGLLTIGLMLKAIIQNN